MKSLFRAALAAAITALPAAAQEGRAVVVEGARLHVAPGTVLEGDAARVAFRGGKVLAVGPEIPGELLERARRVRYEGATITPGFVVAHDHLGLGEDLAEPIDAFTPELRASDAFDPFDEALSRFVRGGVTTVGLAPLSRNTFAGIAAVVSTDGEMGTVISDDSYLKLALVRSSLDSQRFPTSRMGAADLVRERFDAARDPLGPPSPALEVLREAADGTRRVAIHAQTHGEIVTALELANELGVQPILLGARELEESVGRLRGSGVSVVLGALDFESPRETLELPAALERAGVPFSMVAGDPRALRVSMALAVRHGASTAAVIESVTRTPAAQLGVADRVGTLLVDREADLAVFDGDPTDLTTEPIAVWNDGAAVVEPKPAEELTR